MAIEFITLKDADDVERQIAADQIGNLFVQVLKFGFGGDGVLPTLVDASNPLPVTSPTAATAAKQDLAKAVLDAIAASVDGLETNTAGLATQTTLAAILAAVDQLEGYTDGLEALLTAVRDKSADVATALTSLQKKIATAGAAAAIVGSATPCKWVTLTGLKTNTADVYVGGSGVVADAGSQTGIPLEPGGTVTIPVDDAAKIFVDVLANNEGVSFLVGA